MACVPYLLIHSFKSDCWKRDLSSTHYSALSSRASFATSRSSGGRWLRSTHESPHCNNANVPNPEVWVGSFASGRVCPLSAHCEHEFLRQGRGGPAGDVTTLL